MKFLIFLLVNAFIVNGSILDNKHTLRYDGEVNIGKNHSQESFSFYFFLLPIFTLHYICQNFKRTYFEKKTFLKGSLKIAKFN